MRAVRLALEQDITLTSNDNHRFSHVFTLTSKSESGVLARGNADEQRLLELDLKTIRFVAPEFRMKGGVKKPISIEDKFMLENMSPKATGRIVSNNYFLTVRCEYEGCTCCSALPVARTPVTIVPMMNPQLQNYQ